MNNPNNDVTVVIPTLGSSSIGKTIVALNSGTLKPQEILICIPSSFAERIPPLLPPNARKLVTDVTGQVPQRQFGFRAADNEYVLQLDDDIEVARDCLMILRDYLLKMDHPTCVAPKLIDTSHQEPRDHSARRIIVKLLYRIFNGKEGYRDSAILKCGLNSGIPSDNVLKIPTRTEWLPGGAVLHRKDHLILQPFYPFSGKAYCEDIIHSHLLGKAGVNLILHPEARAYYSYQNSNSLHFKSFMEYFRHDFRIRRYFVRMTKRSTTRLCFYYIFLLLNYFLYALKKHI